MRMRAGLQAPPRLLSLMMRKRCKDENGFRHEIYEGGHVIVLAIYYSDWPYFDARKLGSRGPGKKYSS